MIVCNTFCLSLCSMNRIMIMDEFEHSLDFFFNYSVASWFISPLLSGFMSGLLFVLIRIFILKKVSGAATFN